MIKNRNAIRANILKMRKNPHVRTKSDIDRGYHSSNDPSMDNISSDMYEQIIKNHFIQRGCWIPSRYKKFPRFTIFTNSNNENKKEY